MVHFSYLTIIQSHSDMKKPTCLLYYVREVTEKGLGRMVSLNHLIICFCGGGGGGTCGFLSTYG